VSDIVRSAIAAHMTEFPLSWRKDAPNHWSASASPDLTVSAWPSRGCWQWALVTRDDREISTADWVRVACWTGARKEEVNSLQWADVDLGARTLRIRGTKTTKSDRVIPLAPAMVTWLVDRPEKQGRLVKRWINPHLTIGKACVRAGIPHCTAHDFRRTFASKLKQRGVDSMIVGKILGHASGQQVERIYGRLNLDSLRGAMELV